MQTLKRIAAVILALALVLSLAACGGGGNTAPANTNTSNTNAADTNTTPNTNNTDTPEPPAKVDKYGGTLIVSQIGQQYEDNFYPPKAANANIMQNIRPCLEPLFEMASDGTLIPFLLESYETLENGGVYVFHLRQGIKFHDGTDFNAEAVKWNIEHVKDGGIHGTYNSVDKVEVVDEYTVKLTMVNPNLFFINTMATSQACLMVSPTSVEQHDEDWAATHPVGTGPFKLDSWEYGVEMVFSRFDDYWGVDEEGNKLPYLDGITFKFVPEEVSVLTSFENKEIDMLRMLSTVAVAQLEKDFNVTVYDYPAQAYYLWFPTNIDGSPFQDVRVRQAVSYALDMPTIVGSLYGSEFTDINQLSYHGSVLWDDTIQGYEYNVEKAKELLKEAGYPDLKTQIVMENNDQNSVLCETLKSYLADAGIELDIDLADSARFAQTVMFSSWGDRLAVIPFTYSPDEICSMLRMLDPDTSLFAHTVRYPDKYKELLNKMRNSATIEEANGIYKQINKLLIDETSLCVPIFCNSYAIATQDYVHNTGTGLDGETQIRFWSPETIWMDKNR